MSKNTRSKVGANTSQTKEQQARTAEKYAREVRKLDSEKY